MKVFSTFKEQNFDNIKTLMTEFPLATIAVASGDTLEACHTPLIWQDDGSEYDCLVGHVAKINLIYEQNLTNSDKNWLVIFQDTGHYISPNWYPDKAKTHKEVPT